MQVVPPLQTTPQVLQWASSERRSAHELLQLVRFCDDVTMTTAECSAVEADVTEQCGATFQPVEGSRSPDRPVCVCPR